MIESDKSQSRISRSIRARTASLADEIKFIEIPMRLLKSWCLSFATIRIRPLRDDNSFNLPTKSALPLLRFPYRTRMCLAGDRCLATTVPTLCRPRKNSHEDPVRAWRGPHRFRHVPPLAPARQRPAGAPLTKIKSIGPPGLSSSKTPTVSRPVRQASVSRLVRPSSSSGPSG
jgi:hypothetical protein